MVSSNKYQQELVSDGGKQYSKTIQNESENISQKNYGATRKFLKELILKRGLVK